MAINAKIEENMKKIKRQYNKQNKELIKTDNINQVIKNGNEVTESMLTDYLTTMGLTNKMSDIEKIKFLQIAKAYQLNPFKREIYAYISEYDDVNRNHHRDLTVVTGYEVYLKRAERTGKLDGWKAWIDGSGDSTIAKIMIYRKDWKFPFEHSVKMMEYRQNKKMWKTMPEVMLKKVVTGTGFRLCFPDDMGGLPYLPEEILDDNHKEIEYKQIKTETKQQKEAKEKLDSLSDYNKQGFKILDYTDKVKYQFCADRDWNEDRIHTDIDKIVERQNKQNE